MERFTSYILKYGVWFLFFVLIAIVGLIAIYRNSNNVDLFQLGGPESFGQFGDYIGGLLNPIFGFITVCLLIATAYLSNKQVDDSKAQLELSRDEYNRKQLEEVLNSLLQLHSSILDKKLKEIVSVGASHYYDLILRDLLIKESSPSSYTGIFISIAESVRLGVANPQIKSAYAELHNNTLQINDVLYDLLKLTHVKSIKGYWNNKAKVCRYECVQLGVYTEEQSKKWEAEIFNFKHNNEK